jgi:hypothetical protein
MCAKRATGPQTQLTVMVLVGLKIVDQLGLKPDSHLTISSAFSFYNFWSPKNTYLNRHRHLLEQIYIYFLLRRDVLLHYRRRVERSRSCLSKMSAILSADDLNDFISPGVVCVKPVETLPAVKSSVCPFHY